MSVFSRFPERLQHAIAHELGFASLRPVQELAGEAILDGKNAVVLAPTAGGKTEASLFPVIGGMLLDPPTGVGALYIAPIKALLNNQEVRLGQYTEMVGLRRFVWHGDALQGQKQAFCREPAELLMTTPESLEVMLMSPRVPVSRLFKSLRYAVIDEVHAFAGTDRGAHPAEARGDGPGVSPQQIPARPAGQVAVGDAGRLLARFCGDGSLAGWRQPLAGVTIACAACAGTGGQAAQPDSPVPERLEGFGEGPTSGSSVFRVELQLRRRPPLGGWRVVRRDRAARPRPLRDPQLAAVLREARALDSVRGPRRESDGGGGRSTTPSRSVASLPRPIGGDLEHAQRGRRALPRRSSQRRDRTCVGSLENRRASLLVADRPRADRRGAWPVEADPALRSMSEDRHHQAPSLLIDLAARTTLNPGVREGRCDSRGWIGLRSGGRGKRRARPGRCPVALRCRRSLRTLRPVGRER